MFPEKTNIILYQEMVAVKIHPQVKELYKAV